MYILTFLLGALLAFLYHRYKLGSYHKLALDILAKGELEAKHLKEIALLEIKHQQAEQKRELEEERKELKVKEERHEQRQQLIEKKGAELEKKEAQLQKKERELAQTASLTMQEAKEFLLAKASQEIKSEVNALHKNYLKEVEERSEQEAARILSTAINRQAASSVSEHTINTVSIPNDEIKARIIGREGRNIRCLERETGVNFLIDDTPGAIVLSCFDPVRLHTARVALQDLIHDGRIHPTRIEEAVERARHKIAKEIQLKAEEAALQAGILHLHPELMTLVGKMAYRYSLGQNLLAHSLEVSHLMGIMAAELHLDVKLAKKIGLLHDIGKAASHEMEGSHALIGFQLTQKYGESLEVSNGIGCHHNEMEPITIEGSLCSAADTLSASRPGARLESVENYIKRLHTLEKIAYEFPGVEKAYALQAGKEIRVNVLPDLLDDEGTRQLARAITKRIEEELKYPGKIKITLIREQRITEYAY